MATKRDPNQKARDAALREAVLPQVDILVDALMAQGMGREKALQTIRWATHKLTKPDRGWGIGEPPQAPERNPDEIQVFGGNHVKRG